MVNLLIFQIHVLYHILFSPISYFFMQLFSNIHSEIENSVDPDQTASGAVWSGHAPFAYAIFFQKVWCMKFKDIYA